MVEYDKKLCISCIFVMILVEERCVIRFFGGKFDVDIDDYIFVSEFFLIDMMYYVY